MRTTIQRATRVHGCYLISTDTDKTQTYLTGCVLRAYATSHTCLLQERAPITVLLTSYVFQENVWPTYLSFDITIAIRVF